MATGNKPETAKLRNPHKTVKCGGSVIYDQLVWVVEDITRKNGRRTYLTLKREGEQPIEVQARFCDPGPRWGGGE